MIPTTTQADAAPRDKYAFEAIVTLCDEYQIGWIHFCPHLHPTKHSILQMHGDDEILVQPSATSPTKWTASTPSL